MPVALFVFKNASPTEIYTLSLHDALPIFLHRDDHLLVLDKPHDMATMPRGAHVLSSADRKSTRLNSSHVAISYAVFCLKKKNDTAALVNVVSLNKQNHRPNNDHIHIGKTK